MSRVSLISVVSWRQSIICFCYRFFSLGQVLGFLLPAENVTATDGDGGFLNATERWTNANWTERWFDLVDEDPTIRFTDAEYLSKSSEVRTAQYVCARLRTSTKRDYNVHSPCSNDDLTVYDVAVWDVLDILCFTLDRLNGGRHMFGTVENVPHLKCPPFVLCGLFPRLL